MNLDVPAMRGSRSARIVRCQGLLIAMAGITVAGIVTLSQSTAERPADTRGTPVIVVATNRQTVSTTPSLPSNGITRAVPWNGQGWPRNNWHGGGWRGR